MQPRVTIFENIEQLISDAEQLVERRNPEALPLAERIMGMALQNGSLQHFAHAKYILAFYNCLVANDYDEAISLCEEVLERLQEDDLRDISYKIYMTLGNSYQLKGETYSAQTSYLKGLRQLESKKELSRREEGFLASFYYNLFLLLRGSELDLHSEEHLEKAISIYEKNENGFKLSKCYVAYAGVYEDNREYYRAIEYLHRALEIDIKNNDAYSISLTKANLGIMHMHIRETEKAFGYLKEAIEYFTKNNMVFEHGMVKSNMAEALHAIGNIKDAIRELRIAEHYFAQLDNKRELNKVHELLAQYIAETSDYRAAYDYHKKYTEGLKYLFNTEKTNALTRAKKEFESEQKEKETILLREKNEEIKNYVVKLERSNNELKQFAHVASHDLREPLRMISSYMNLLQKSLNNVLNEQQTEFFSFALNGAVRMDQLIVDLLRLAKVDANPRVEAVNLNTLAEEIKLNLELLIKDKNALVAINHLPVIMADRTMMSQLLQNIVGNGIKYNENSQPTIRIKQRMAAGELEISISDNGIGIPEHLREKAFQIFQRLPTDKTYPGSGIGLAICKKITESMGGKIAIADTPGGGTTFRIFFPAALVVNC